MVRLPSVGGDNGQWGQILNDFLSVEHNPDGTLKKAGDISSALSTASAAQADAASAQSTADGKYTKPAGGIPETDLDSSVQTKLNAGASGVPDATSSIKGKLQLAGDLTGTASSPQVAAGAITDAKIAIGANIGQSKIQNLPADLASKYEKPGSGIPASDLTASAQTALLQAGTAEQAANKGQAGGYASLDGAGKVPLSQLPNALLRYQGVWNATTNSPMLADGSGDAGDVYRVTVAGTQNLGSGAITYTVGDYVIYNPSGVWEKSDTTDSVASVAGKTGVVTLDKNDVGLANVQNVDTTLRANHTGTQPASTISDFDSATDARITLQKGAAGGVASLDGTGKIPGTQLPALALTNTFTVASQTAQLALDAQEGDLAIRTDEGKTYVHNGGIAGTMADWSELLSVGDQATVGTKVNRSGDTMTGALNLPTDGLTVGTSQLTVANNGTAFAVGIGTATPASAGTNRTALHIQDTVGNGGEIRLNSTSLQARLFNNNSEFGFGTDTNHPIRFFVNGGGNTALTLNSTVSATFSGNVGIGGAAASQALTIPSTSASSGIAIYNTADQTTNYDRFRQYFSGNILFIQTESGGTGVRRNIVVDANGTQYQLGTTVGTGSSFGHLLKRDTTGLSLVNIGSSGLLASSGTQFGLLIDPTMNQSGTAGYTMLKINPTHSAVGSGTKLLAEFAVGGTSRVTVADTGATAITATSSALALDVKSAGQVFKTTQDGGSGQSVFSLARINHATQNNEWLQLISNGSGVLGNGSLIVYPNTNADISFSGVSGAYDHLVLKADKKVGIGTNAPSATLEITSAGSTTVPQVRITPATSVSGAMLLHFNTERPWGFAQHATGAGTALELRNYSSDKYFRIKADSGTYNTFVVGASTTPANNSVGIGLDPVVGGGRLQFAAGTTAADGIVAGTDTNLYRQAADTWRTDDTFSAQTLYASNGLTVAAGNISATASNVLLGRLDSVYANSLTNNVYSIGNADAGKYHAFSPAPKYIWHDNLRFLRWTGTPTFEKQRVSDSVWESATLSKTPFNGKESQSVEVADGTTYKGARWTWNNGNFQYGYNLWWLIGFPYIGATASNKTITIESSSDGTNWTTKFSATNQTNNATPALCYMNDNAGDQYVRLTITVTNSLPIRVASIKALSSRQGNQGGGVEYEEPYDWDDDRKITIGTTSGARSNGVLNIAGTNPTTAAEGIYFGTDVNLYRSAADSLKTDDQLQGALNIYARHSSAAQVTIGNVGPASEAAILFGSGNDTNLYRSGANELKTDDSFVIGSNRLNIATSKTPTSATDTGTTGDIAWDANYMYVCVAPNTWKRTALTTW